MFEQLHLQKLLGFLATLYFINGNQKNFFLKDKKPDKISLLMLYWQNT